MSANTLTVMNQVSAVDRPATRRTSLLVAAATSLATVLLASFAATTHSENQVGVTPFVVDAAVTEAGRARQVATFATNYQPDIDPIVTLSDGRQVKASNYNGIQIGASRYYYSLSPHYSLDPLSRGQVTRDQIVIKERITIEEGFVVTVYTIPR